MLRGARYFLARCTKSNSVRLLVWETNSVQSSENMGCWQVGGAAGAGTSAEQAVLLATTAAGTSAVAAAAAGSAAREEAAQLPDGES